MHLIPTRKNGIANLNETKRRGYGIPSQRVASTQHRRRHFQAAEGIVKLSKTLLLLVVLIGVAGCGPDFYSSAVQYNVRTDPLVLEEVMKDELYDPDPPGQLPLYKPDGVLDPRNPLSVKGMSLFTEGTPPPLRDPMQLTKDARASLRQGLDKMFGSPRRPKVAVLSVQSTDKYDIPPILETTGKQAAELNARLKQELQLEPHVLRKGSRLYRLHCLHCHGVTGDGLGPTAQWVNPHPRDYRRGLFKYQSVDRTEQASRKPRREDLHRVIQLGVEGTSMPAHNLLSDSEIDALVSYVIHLSIRGESEYQTIRQWFEFKNDTLEKNPSLNMPLSAFLRIQAVKIADSWLSSQEPSVKIEPVEYPESYKTFDGLKRSVLRGQALFNANKEAFMDTSLFTADEVKGRLKSLEGAACKQCHVDYGRRAKFKWDKWGTLVRARNFTTGVFRGGRRPVDLYYRIHSGIPGSGMLIQGNVLKGEEIWDLVNFVQALPYPDMRKKFGIKLNE